MGNFKQNKQRKELQEEKRDERKKKPRGLSQCKRNTIG